MRRVAQVRCTGEFSKAVWIYGGQYVFDDSYKGGGRIVDEYAGPDAVLKRSTIGGFCEGGAGGSCGWGMLTWQLAKVSVEDCLIEDAHFIGISACHASSVSVLGCTVEGCRVGAVLVNEEASMRVETCLLRDNACALVAGKEAMLASLHVVGNVIHGRVWHDSWGGQVVEGNKEEPHPDGLPLFLGTWTDRGRIGDPDPSDVERYVRRVRANTWSRLPVRLSRPDAEQVPPLPTLLAPVFSTHGQHVTASACPSHTMPSAYPMFSCFLPFLFGAARCLCCSNVSLVQQRLSLLLASLLSCVYRSLPCPALR
jgi:hypothetical protein